MSKGSRAAQERARIQQEKLRLEQRRVKRRRIYIAAGSVAAVVAAVGVMVVVKVTGGSSPKPAASGEVAAAVTAATGVPAAVLDKVGKGTIKTLLTPLPNQPPLTADGKPLLVYFGAEYCPFCASQRWPVVVALSRFGTFSGLSLTSSASDDSFPNTATLTFHGAKYTSQYLTFQGVETRGRERVGGDYPILDKPTAEQQKLMQTYNAPPYVAKEEASSIPFFDLGNKWMVAGSNFSPSLLTGKSAQQIATDLSNPDSEIGKAVGGAANLFTAAICKLTNGQPGNVCAPGTPDAAATAYAGNL